MVDSVVEWILNVFVILNTNVHDSRGKPGELERNGTPTPIKLHLW